MKVEQSVPKRRHIKFRGRGITRKQECNIENKTKVWNQEQFTCLHGVNFSKIWISLATIAADSWHRRSCKPPWLSSPPFTGLLFDFDVSDNEKPHFVYEQTVLTAISKRMEDRYFKGDLLFVIFGNWNRPSLLFLTWNWASSGNGPPLHS